MIWKMLAAPVIGAIIGYCTNWLAVKMLFRPREEKYIGRFRVPFTPGVIPKGKKRLANAVYNVINDQLLTEDAVKGKLLSDDMVNMIKTSVNERAEELKNDETATVGTLIGKAAASQPENLVSIGNTGTAALTGESGELSDGIMPIDNASMNNIDNANNNTQSASPLGDKHSCEENCSAAVENLCEESPETDKGYESDAGININDDTDISVNADLPDVQAGKDEDNYSKLINDIKIFLTKRIFAKVSEANIGNIAAETVNSKLSEAISGSFIGQMMGSSITGMIGPAISQTVDKYIEENGEAMIGNMVGGEVDSVLGMKLGDILKNVENNGIDLGEKAAEIYVRVVKEKSGDMLRALDLGGIIKETIEEMDNEQLEELVMSTMKTELSAVVNFGAIIGLALGFVNMFIYML